MKIIYMLFVILFSALSQANTSIKYNSTVGNQSVVTVNYCPSRMITWINCAGGNPIALTTSQSLNIENVCQIPVTGGAYQVTVLSQASIIQSCLHTNGVGIITQSNPNSSPKLSGSFYGNGTACGTPCG
jgi:hypothetical protein